MGSPNRRRHPRSGRRDQLFHRGDRRFESTSLQRRVINEPQGKVTQRYRRGSGISDTGQPGRVPSRVLKASDEGFTLFVLQELNREDDSITLLVVFEF